MPIITTSDITLENAIADIIESIALEQAGLSHILNAEGEKIQAVIAKDATTTSELLKVNESVKATIDAITKLEIILQGKLELVSCQICK